MFQNAEKPTISCTLTLTSGERMRGEIVLSRQQPLQEAMNKPDQWIEFLSRDGRTMSIAKHSIESVWEAETADVSQLDLAKTDPYRILGVSTGSEMTVIRDAYLAKVRLYHPDNYASVPLPAEVAEYMEGMFVLVRDAYEEIGPRSRRGEESEAA